MSPSKHRQRWAQQTLAQRAVKLDSTMEFVVDRHGAPSHRWCIHLTESALRQARRDDIGPYDLLGCIWLGTCQPIGTSKSWLHRAVFAITPTPITEAGTTTVVVESCYRSNP